MMRSSPTSPSAEISAKPVTNRIGTLADCVNLPREVLLFMPRHREIQQCQIHIAMALEMIERGATATELPHHITEIAEHRGRHLAHRIVIVDQQNDRTARIDLPAQGPSG